MYSFSSSSPFAAAAAKMGPGQSSQKSSVAAPTNFYHPERSRITERALTDFIRAPISGDLVEVPGIGPVTARLLADAGVDSTFALIGKFLTLKTHGVESVEHLDRFYHWLTSIESKSQYRAGVCQAIAEKANSMMPGIYDADVY